MEDFVYEELLQKTDTSVLPELLPRYLRGGDNKSTLVSLAQVLPYIMEEFLSSEEREVVNWVHVQEKPRKELAQRLNTSASTISRRYRRAMGELTQKMGLAYQIAQVMTQARDSEQTHL